VNRRETGGGNFNCRWAGILIVADQEKDRASVRDVERYLRGHGEEIRRHLSAWLDGGEKAGGVAARRVAM
jgi:hypothetical protein